MRTVDRPLTTHEPFARYLVAVDDSPASANAARLAVRLARGHGAELVFCHAIDIHRMLVQADRTFDDFPAVLASAREVARDILDRCCMLADRAGVFARSYVREGRPAEAVAALASAIGADLIVVGNRAHAARLALVPPGYDGWRLAIDRAVNEHHPGMIVVGAPRRPSWRDPLPSNPVACVFAEARVPVLAIAEPPAG